MDETASSSAEHKGTLIVAGNDVALRHLLATALRDKGDIIIEVGSGLSLFDALRHLRNRNVSPSMVIVDQHLAGLTGLEVLETIREWGWRMPVLLIASIGDDEELLRRRALELGADGVLDKPFDVEELRLIVRFLLRKARRTEQDTIPTRQTNSVDAAPETNRFESGLRGATDTAR